MYLYARSIPSQRSIAARAAWNQLSGLDDDPQTRAGTLVLYARPPDGTRDKKVVWSFDTSDGRREYETALHNHLAAQKIVPDKGTAYEPMTSSSDIARLARNTFENLVLIVHSAGDAPAIAVDLAIGDWLKDEAVGKVLSPLAYTKVTVLGCDAVENKFAPNLAARLPASSTVIGHQGGKFIIGRHFEPHKKIKGRMVLTHVTSNFNLKAFKGKK